MFIVKTIFLHLLTLSILFGQNQSQDKFSFWGGGGFGISFLDQGSSLASFQYSIALRSGNTSLKIINIQNVEFLDGIIFPSELPQEIINTWSLQLGLTFYLLKNSDGTLNDDFNLNIYTGYSSYHGVKRGNLIADNLTTDEFEKIEKSGSGWPIELELEWHFNNYCGFTADYHLEINEFRNYHALQINFIIGFL